jgi:hypothetical protein
LIEGAQGPTYEPEERSWMRLHAHHLIHPTHEITLRATPIEELSMMCNLYLSILGRKDSPTAIVSGFPK